MSVGFARYDKGATNEWMVTYDEALILTKGVFTVGFAGGAKTAKAGEIIFLPKGAKVVCHRKEDGGRLRELSALVRRATQFQDAGLLDAFHRVSQPTRDR